MIGTTHNRERQAPTPVQRNNPKFVFVHRRRWKWCVNASGFGFRSSAPEGGVVFGVQPPQDSSYQSKRSGNAARPASCLDSDCRGPSGLEFHKAARLSNRAHPASVIFISGHGEPSPCSCA